MSLMIYLDELKKLTDTGTDYAVAKLLEIDPDTIGSWRKRGTIPDPATCFRIADLLALEREQVLIDIHLAGAKREKERRVWEALAGKAAMLVSGICLTSLLSFGDNLQAAHLKQSLPTFSPGQSGDGVGEKAEPLYIMLNAVSGWLRRAFGRNAYGCYGFCGG